MFSLNPIRLTCFILTFTLAGCGSVPLHSPVPEPLTTAANPEGFPSSIRSYEDSSSKGLGRVIEKRVEQYTEQHASYYQQHKKYPAMNYLALSGGSNNGAFSAGLLKGWSQTGTRPEFTVVTGVSTGALIAPFAFLGPQYDELLREQYTTIKSDNIFIGDVWTVLSGLTGGMALVDAKPLRDRIDRLITKDMLDRIAKEHNKGRLLLIATTNIETQRAVIWNIGVIANSGHPKALELFKKILLASAAVPGIFEPVFIDVTVDGKAYQEIHVDGGLASQVFLFPTKSSRMDREAFAKHHIERNLYIIRNSKVTPEYKALEPGFYALSERSIDTLIKNQGVSDLYELYSVARRDGMDYRLLYIPSEFKDESKEIFDTEYMKKLYNVGVELGKRNEWLHQPPGFQYID